VVYSSKGANSNPVSFHVEDFSCQISKRFEMLESIESTVGLPRVLQMSGVTVARNVLPCFQVIFRSAKNALRWCIAVQMQLLRVDWSPELLQASPANAGVVRASAASSMWPAQPLAEVPEAFKCLAGSKLEEVLSDFLPLSCI
jgi:hypothetical protein